MNNIFNQNAGAGGNTSATAQRDNIPMNDNVVTQPTESEQASEEVAVTSVINTEVTTGTTTEDSILPEEANAGAAEAAKVLVEKAEAKISDSTEVVVQIIARRIKIADKEYQRNERVTLPRYIADKLKASGSGIILGADEAEMATNAKIAAAREAQANAERLQKEADDAAAEQARLEADYKSRS